MTQTPPPLIGLCPGPDSGEFYVPLQPGESTTCPACTEPLVLYVHADTVAALIDATPLHLRNTNLAAKIKAMVAPTATHLPPGERI